MNGFDVIQWAGCLVTVVGCATTGTATGELVESAKTEPVTFTWAAEPGNAWRGEIAVTLPGGEKYAGVFRQVHQTLREEDYAPLWEGYEPYWPRWGAPNWFEGPPATDPASWVKVYAGTATARLQATDPSRYMRCRFKLQQPELGLKGGGEGECELSNGESIRSAVLRAKS